MLEHPSEPAAGPEQRTEGARYLRRAVQAGYAAQMKATTAD